MENMNNETYLKYLEMVQNDGKALQYVPSEYQTEELCMTAVKQNGWTLEYVKKQTPEICLEAIKENPFALEYVENQTEEMCKLAVSLDRVSLQCIRSENIKNEIIKNDETYLNYLEKVQKNRMTLRLVWSEYRTPELCMEAVKRDGRALEYVENQTPEICLAAIKEYSFALKWVKNQTPEICLAAVKQNGNALKYVKNRTPELCMEAVKRNGHALAYVKKQTPETCLEAVKRDGLALEYVENQTPELCMEAVKQNGLALEYVKDQTKELCLEAIKQNPSALLFVKEQTPEICMEAVKLDGERIQDVKNQSFELCLEAVKQNYSAFYYIKDEDLKEKIKNEIIESKLFKETDTYRAFITDGCLHYGVNCHSAYKSPKDNNERPVTIVLDTKYNDITVLFKNKNIKCNTIEELKTICKSNDKFEKLYKWVQGSNDAVTLCLNDNDFWKLKLPDDEYNKVCAELFTDVIMKIDESVREHYDLSKNIKDKEIEDKNYNDMEL